MLTVNVARRDAHSNRLTGDIPSSIGYYTAMNYLCVTESLRNRLYGNASEFIHSFLYIHRSLHSNSLTGITPHIASLTVRLIGFNGFFHFHFRVPCPTRSLGWLAGANKGLRIVSQDRAALIDLFNAASGIGWTHYANWNTAAAMCMWAGVTCNSTVPPRVVKLCV